MSTRLLSIPIHTLPSSERACSGAEPFALMVLGSSMAPEFEHGDIVIIEPDGLATDGAFVLAHARGEWMLRQLRRQDSGWALAVLDGSEPPLPIGDLAAVRGVVIQRNRGGRRRFTKRYVE
ncbi:MAG: S24 family peptidase [Sutterellaceae bacterium]|nr:S24 family peptidase [Burkholderiaceae bacterium]MCX7901385.1 S24 family peptidase [Burkholderiaceae bacterium]MDW8429397.1 S24 family peptidase [Sutterellaceae bacterium]